MPFRFRATVTTLSLALTLALGLGLTGLSAPQARADMMQHLGPMAGAVELGQDGEWLIEDKGGWLILTNTESRGAVRYYWMEVPGSQGDNYVVGVNLVAQAASEEPAFAGFLYNYKAKDSYFIVAIGSDGGGYLFIRTPEGFKTQRATKVEARNDGSDVMRAHVSGNKVRFEVNGVTLADMENPDGFSPKLGIAAIGQGQFGFTGFSIN